jgi:hypothetical protein
MIVLPISMMILVSAYLAVWGALTIRSGIKEGRVRGRDNQLVRKCESPASFWMIITGQSMLAVMGAFLLIVGFMSLYNALFFSH